MARNQVETRENRVGMFPARDKSRYAFARSKFEYVGQAKQGLTGGGGGGRQTHLVIKNIPNLTLAANSNDH